MSSNEGNTSETVASRKFAAKEFRIARRSIRDPRNRLFSDSSDEAPKGILKNARIPTKRSVSECVDDLSQIMDHLNLDIHDLPKTTGKFCPKHHNYFDEEEEDSEYGNNDVDYRKTGKDPLDREECDCNFYNGDNDDSNKPKKSVRFDGRVYETVFFASRLYDRRYFTKYHFSSRHHPPGNQQVGNNNKSKKIRQNGNQSKSDSSKEDFNGSTTSLKSSNNSKCKLSKSQRAKQSKKDKKRRLNKKDDVAETSGDDLGYCSSLHSFSD